MSVSHWGTKMITLSRVGEFDVKKVHCPICGGRLCDVKMSEQIFFDKNNMKSEIVLKCYKCGNKIGISIQ